MAVAAGGGLLPGNESDHSPAAHLHERRRRLLGSGQAAVRTEARHARWDSWARWHSVGPEELPLSLGFCFLLQGSSSPVSQSSSVSRSITTAFWKRPCPNWSSTWWESHELYFYHDHVLMWVCAAAGQTGGVYQSVHHEVVLPVLPGQSEYVRRPKLFQQYKVIMWPALVVQTPFTLTLRIWDIYILEGERLLPAMSYTILKLHKSKSGGRAVWTAADVTHTHLRFVGFSDRTLDEALNGGTGGVPAGDPVQELLLWRRLCDRAASGFHDGAQESEVGASTTRYWHTKTLSWYSPCLNKLAEFIEDLLLVLWVLF